jgi:uncharacterized RmlC-like cupin family protein
VQALRPDRAVMTQQRLPYFIGISGQTVGASGLSMHIVVIPPGVPHEAINLSATETARAVVARNDPAEQDKVEPYNVVAPADGR